MLGWAESIAVWLLELPVGAKAWVLVAAGLHMAPLLAGAGLAASMHAWMDPRDPVKWWRKLPVAPFRQVLLASRRRAVVASLAMLAWSLPLVPMLAVERAAWTQPEAVAAYERSVEDGDSFGDAAEHTREVRRSMDGSESSYRGLRKKARGRVFPWAGLGFALAGAIAFQGFLWLGYARHAADVQAELAGEKRRG
ncbi:MAG: hypothetical protein ACIAS6_12725 [Phycisphaerales bacterium JB060]